MVACDREVHEVLKVARPDYEAATEFRGWQEDGEGGELELRNCACCGSTLCDGTRRARAA
jgi:hypothetical protein